MTSSEDMSKEECGCKCSVCHWNPSQDCRKRTWSLDLAALKASSQECETCSVFADAIETIAPNCDEVYMIPRVVQAFGQPIRFGFDLRDRRTNSLELPWANGSWELFTCPGLGSFRDIFSASNVLPGDTSSEISFGTAQKWLEICLSKHSKCNTTSTRTSVLPHRVVDVSPFDSKGTVRLLETADGEEGRYVCLSHCWGTSAKPMQTTTSNIERQKLGIPKDELPRTFQDAIDVVRRLGVRFIWIDSLCIVQDDTADWLLHAKSMATIYQHAYLTLAATWSSDGAAGCYSVTDEYKEILLTREEQTFGIFVRRPLPHWWHSERFSRFYHNRKFPLLNRAWVFQGSVIRDTSRQ